MRGRVRRCKCTHSCSHGLGEGQTSDEYGCRAAIHSRCYSLLDPAVCRRLGSKVPHARHHCPVFISAVSDDLLAWG